MRALWASRGRARMRTSAPGPGWPWAGSRGAEQDGRANVARVMEGDETAISVQQSRGAFLKAQAKTCQLYIAPYATHLGGLNPLQSKSVFQPL